jgi:hypothetical protein
LKREEKAMSDVDTELGKAMKPTILVQVECVAETAVQVAETLADVLRSFDQEPSIRVSDGSGAGTRVVEIKTHKLFTEEAAEALFAEPGYDAVMECDGVLAATVISSSVLN